MDEMDVFRRMGAMVDVQAPGQMGMFSELEEKVREHRTRFQVTRRERPSTSHPYKIGVYIRYFNQTKYGNYLEFHKKQFEDTIALCPRWTLEGFYIDVGSSAPNMRSANDWSRLLDDCIEGKIDLVITQKLSNIMRQPFEMTLCARILAAQKPPIGIYFISEDIFTLASYYQEDLHDPYFLPSPDWKVLPDRQERERGAE